MALAILEFKGINESVAEFELDIGTNKFYKIKIGRNKVNTHGLDLIDEIIYETPLLTGPDFNIFISRFTVPIPKDRFNLQPKYAQLFSFKDDRRKSPAISKIVQISPELNLANEDLPAMTSAFKGLAMNQYQITNKTHGARAVSFSFEESALSAPMFWDALIAAARFLAPSVVNTLASLVGAANGQSANNENIVRIINAVLDALRQDQKTSAVSNSSAEPKVHTEPTPSAPAVPKTQSYDYLSFQRSISREGRNSELNGLSRQQFAWAALAPLVGPALQYLPQLLGPFLQQSPQLLQGLADSPMKLLSVLNEGINQQGQLQLQGKLANQKHIENLLGDTLNNYLILQEILKSQANVLPAESLTSSPFIAQSSMAFGLTATKPKSTMIIQKDNPVTVNGKPKFVYSGKGSIKLLVHLNIIEGIKNGKIAKAIINLCIKDTIARRTLLEKSFRLKDIAVNSMQELELLPTEIQNLPRNKDLLVSITSRYLGAGNKPYTCGADLHIIFIANDYFYKGIGNKIGESIPLNDRTRYRIFWNKIWEGGAKTKRRWEINLTTKYYIYYRYDQSTNGRIETRIQQVQPDSESESKLNIEGKMKSGLEITPIELNNLLPSISSYNSLEEAKLEAFKTDELSKDYNSEALTSLKMKGKTDETGIIWTYPEIALFEFTLNKISKVDQNGQVTEISEEKIVFPEPVSIHFVGEKTSRTGTSYGASMEEEDTGIEDDADKQEVKDSQSDGYEKVFDIKVELRPVELAPIKINT